MLKTSLCFGKYFGLRAGLQSPVLSSHRRDMLAELQLVRKGTASAVPVIGTSTETRL